MNVHRYATALLVLATLVLVAVLAGTLAAHATRVTTAPATIPTTPLEDALTANGNPYAHVTGSLLVIRDAAPGDGVLVLPPGRALTAGELDALADHAARGGRVLVLGHADAARALGVAIGSAPVRADAPDGRVPGTSVGDASARVPLALPDARALADARDGARALAVTGNASFLDADGDGRMSAGDAVGPFPVASADRDARVIIVASRGLATADALAHDGNRAFVHALLERAFPPGVRVLVDATGHAAGSVAGVARALAAAPALLAHAPALAAPAGALALAAAGVVAARAVAREEAAE